MSRLRCFGCAFAAFFLVLPVAAQDSKSSCVSAAGSRTETNYLIQSFRNRCSEEKPVAVCAQYRNGTNLLGATVPAKGTADVTIANTKDRPVQKVTWREGRSISCP